MKKVYIFFSIFIFGFILVFNTNVNASAVLGPMCYVTAEIVEHPNIENNFAVKVISINDYVSQDLGCPITENSIYSLTNYSEYFSIGDSIKVGVEVFSSMTPQGVRSAFQWSEVTYSNNLEVPGITSFQTNTQRIFPDVSSNYIYASAINYVQGEGIVDGFSDGTFGPEKTITRAEFTKIVVNAMLEWGHMDDNERAANIGSDCIFLSEGLTYFSQFKDVENYNVKINNYETLETESTGNPFASHICAAKKKGWIGGYSDGEFKPERTITVGEASKILSNAYGLTSEPVQNGHENKFNPYLTQLKEISAVPFTVKYYDRELKRGEMADFIRNLETNDSGKAEIGNSTKIFRTDFKTGAEDCGLMNNYSVHNNIPSGYYNEVSHLIEPANSNFQGVNRAENAVKYVLNSWNLNGDYALILNEFNLSGYLGSIDPEVVVKINKTDSYSFASCEAQMFDAQIIKTVEEILLESNGTKPKVTIEKDWLV